MADLHIGSETCGTRLDGRGRAPMTLPMTARGQPGDGMGEGGGGPGDSDTKRATRTAAATGRKEVGRGQPPPLVVVDGTTMIWNPRPEAVDGRLYGGKCSEERNDRCF